MSGVLTDAEYAEVWDLRRTLGYAPRPSSGAVSAARQRMRERAHLEIREMLDDIGDMNMSPRNPPGSDAEVKLMLAMLGARA